MHRFAIIFTGATTLALQLIASRIMAPFFGVSLYIWTAILSVTLLCLAIGYFMGGRTTARASKQEVLNLFYRMPALSGGVLVLAAALYPTLLGPLARFDLITGAFIASLLLIAIPLVALSALNPFLVALEKPEDGSAGDAGAGWVFFISTLGSVGGVLIAAFVLIPHFSNQTSMLMLASSLSLLALAGIVSHRSIVRNERLFIVIIALATMLSSAVMFWQAPHTGGSSKGWKVTHSYPSNFGALKIVEMPVQNGSIRAIFNDGIGQNAALHDGRSAVLFTHFLETLSLHLVPNPKHVLVLGLGAGVIPDTLARKGAKVDVVEINPRMGEVAEKHFGYRPGETTQIYTEDARTFVHRCVKGQYDVVYIDLFAGDGIPEHLLTREFLSDVRDCLQDKGIVAMNSFLYAASPAYFESILATLENVFAHSLWFRQPSSPEQTITNAFIFAAKDPAALAIETAVAIDAHTPDFIATQIQQTLASAQHNRLLDRTDAAILTDENNVLATLMAPAQLAYRKHILDHVPDAVLVD